jgi:hypothetical protein
MFLIFNDRFLPRLRFAVNDSSLADGFKENELIHVKKLISERLRLAGRSNFIKV